MQQASKAAMALRIGRGSGSFRCGITPWKASQNSHQPHFGYGNFKVYWMQPRYIDTVVGDHSCIGGKEKVCDITCSTTHRRTPLIGAPHQIATRRHNQPTMPTTQRAQKLQKEGRLALATAAIQNDQRLRVYKVAKLYNTPRSTL